MKTTRILVGAMLSASLAAAAAPAAAADVVAQTEPTKVASESKGEAKERLICRRLNRSESRLKSVKACHTAEDWKKIERGEV